MNVECNANCNNSIAWIVVNKIELAPTLVNTAPNPRQNTKPLGPSSMFTGRKEALKQLSEHFDESTASVACATQRVFVLYGMGGGGKTQIALKFANECRARYGSVNIRRYWYNHTYGIFKV